MDGSSSLSHSTTYFPQILSHLILADVCISKPSFSYHCYLQYGCVPVKWQTIYRGKRVNVVLRPAAYVLACLSFVHIRLILLQALRNIFTKFFLC